MVPRSSKVPDSLPTSPRGEPLWLAAGAAVFGVLLGGAAVFLGLQDSPQAPVVAWSRRALPQLPELPATSAASGRDADGSLGDALIDAVAATREMVVTLRSKDTIGAGVVVDETGLVLTNFHVIASEIRDPARTGC
jgi:S1-C subfamily serine protease